MMKASGGGGGGCTLRLLLRPLCVFVSVVQIGELGRRWTVNAASSSKCVIRRRRTLLSMS